MYLETQFYKTVCSQQDEEQWRAARWNGVTASMVPTILGLNEWEKRSHEKVIEDYANYKDTFEEHPSAEAGRYFERPVLNWTQARKEIDYPLISWGQLLQSKAWPWLLATPDAYYVTDQARGYESLELVEVKCHSPMPPMKKKWQGGPPDYVHVQVQTQFAVTGLENGHIVQWHWGAYPKAWPVMRDDKTIALIVKESKKFWKEVEAIREARKTRGT